MVVVVVMMMVMIMVVIVVVVGGIYILFFNGKGLGSFYFTTKRYSIQGTAQYNSVLLRLYLNYLCLLVCLMCKLGNIYLTLMPWMCVM